MRRVPLPALLIVLSVGAVGALAGGEGDATDLARPFAVTAGGRPIDAPFDEQGRPRHDNPYPWVADFDGDGKPDLLVGQRTHDSERRERVGRLRIYTNIGDRGRPRFGEPAWFDDRVPTGRIPGG